MTTAVTAPRRWPYLLPIGLFILLAAGFYIGLGRDTNTLPSPLVDQPAPQFALAALLEGHPGFSSADLQGHVSVVNAFASWCAPCREEHAALTTLTGNARVPLYGIDYKDKPDAARAWLATLGNPYTAIGADDGRAGIAWGIYGVPETFVVDRSGRIRYKHVGPLTEADIRDEVLPLVSRLEK
jgi:cytochrome c biogenesis protein CcmG/thiol:disulfide interchange protein DsbE